MGGRLDQARPTHLHALMDAPAMPAFGEAGAATEEARERSRGIY